MRNFNEDSLVKVNLSDRFAPRRLDSFCQKQRQRERERQRKEMQYVRETLPGLVARKKKHHIVHFRRESSVCVCVSVNDDRTRSCGVLDVD